MNLAHVTRACACRSAHLAPIAAAQQPARAPADVVLLRPARVFDGDAMHEGWVVRVRGDRIEQVGPAASVDASGATARDLPGLTLLPGLIEGHSHVLLHPYNETVWNDQVLKEPLGLRTARATMHLRATLMAGFTTIRDLGTEGAGYADVELKQAIEQGIIPGPRMLVSTRAIVATGSYGPKGYSLEWKVPQGAEEADPDYHRPHRSRSDRSRRRLGEGLRGLSLGPERRDHADLLAGGAEGRRRDRAEQRPPRGGARDGARGHAARDTCGRRDDRARRRRHARGVQADGRASRGALSHACGRRRQPPVRGLEEGHRIRNRRRSRARRPRSRLRSPLA